MGAMLGAWAWASIPSCSHRERGVEIVSHMTQSYAPSILGFRPSLSSPFLSARIRIAPCFRSSLASPIQHAIIPARKTRRRTSEPTRLRNSLLCSLLLSVAHARLSLRRASFLGHRRIVP